jgi:hypothetical protein
MKRVDGFVFLLSCAALVLGASAAAAGEHAYVGSGSCRKCHLKEWKSWSETKMAKAFELLKPGVAADKKKAAGLDPSKDYTADKTCLACHTTGFGQPGGFVDAASTLDRAGVGCEMCHGPGGTYTQEQYMSIKNKEYKKAEVVAVGLVAEVTAARCINCHNEKSPFVGKGYVFNFEERKAKGTHEKFPLKYQH